MKRSDSVKGYIKSHPYVWLTLYLPVYLILYFFVEHLVPTGSDYWVSYMPLDDKIPFVAAFVVPYCTWYPFLIATGIYLLIKDGENFKRYMYFIMFGFTLSLLFCAIFPNGQNLRPEALPEHNLFTWMLHRIYSADTNTNVFPSMHIVGCAAAVGAIFRSPVTKRFRIGALILSVLICMSTVLIKQHSFLDIIGGLALSLPLSLLIYVLPKEKEAVT